MAVRVEEAYFFCSRVPQTPLELAYWLQKKLWMMAPLASAKSNRFEAC